MKNMVGYINITSNLKKIETKRNEEKETHPMVPIIYKYINLFI